MKIIIASLLLFSFSATAQQPFLFSDYQGDHASLACTKKTYIPFSGGDTTEFSTVLTLSQDDFEYALTQEGGRTYVSRIDKPTTEPGSDPFVKRAYGWLADGTLEYTAEYFSKSKRRCSKRSNTVLSFRVVADGIEMKKRHEFYRARRDTYGVTRCHLGSSTIQCLFEK